jgi:hypothetical protein
MLNHNEAAMRYCVINHELWVINLTTCTYTIYPIACSDVMQQKQYSTTMKRHYTIVCVVLACVSDQSHTIRIHYIPKSMLWCCTSANAQPQWSGNHTLRFASNQVKLACVTNATTQAFTICPKACSDVMHQHQCSTTMKWQHTLRFVSNLRVWRMPQLKHTLYAQKHALMLCIRPLLNHNQVATH